MSVIRVAINHRLVMHGPKGSQSLVDGCMIGPAEMVKGPN